LVDGFVKLMDNEKGLVGPVNLGNPGEFTMNELAEAVLEVTGSSSNIEYKPLPEDDPKQRRPDITLATKELGWEPHIQLREGLDHTVQYFRSLLAE
jgi:UDP-glucuronate decarboxylase